MNGKVSRLNGPAEIWPDGSFFYLDSGKFNRLDGPAIVSKYGLKRWFENSNKFMDIHGKKIVFPSEFDSNIFSDDFKYNILKYYPSLIEKINNPSLELQELVLSINPHLVGKIKNLNSKLEQKYKNVKLSQQSRIEL